MTYIAADESADGVSKVICESKDANTSKTFDALDWLARLRRITHIPYKGESAGGGSDITDFTLINHVDYEKRPVSMMKFRP
jgi:hypothetical protein